MHTADLQTVQAVQTVRGTQRQFLENICSEERVSMGLTDRRKTAKNLVDSRKTWKILTVSRKLGKKELTVKEIVP